MSINTRMTRCAFAFAVLIGSLLPALCPAQGRDSLDVGGGGSKFFYTVPSGLQDEWEYTWPKCSPLPASARRGLKNCGPFEEPGLNHLMCGSSEYVEMTNVLTNGKERAMLLYHVFSTKKACVRSREAGLRGH